MTQDSYPYRKLGEKLLAKLGNQKSFTWLADEALVSRVAVSYWMAGTCRPKPQRLGYILAILQFDRSEVKPLAELADYIDGSDQAETVLKAYDKWHAMRQRWQDEVRDKLERYVYDRFCEELTWQ